MDLIICEFSYDIPKEKKRKGKKGRSSTDLHPPQIAWTSHADLQSFITHSYRPFLVTVEPLLVRDNSSPGPTPAPYILQLHPGMPSLELGAVSALYELSFNPKPDADVKTGLAIEAQLCRNIFLDAARGIGDGDSFLGMDAVWMERYDPLASSSSSPPSIPPSTVPDPANETNLDEETQAKENTLLLITDWASPAIETQILHSGTIETSSHDGQVLTTGEYFSKNLLQKASAHTNHHVVFENISPANAAWLDKEEKWSTHVARLVAEEELKGGTEE